MGLRAVTTTAFFTDTVWSKPNAKGFTVQVANNTVLYQVNVPAFGNGENWQPAQGDALLPGFWTFSADDWAEYGAPAQGMRFKANDVTNPAVISVS